MRNQNKWAIVYVMKPYPTAVGEIIDEKELIDSVNNSCHIKFPYGTQLWDKKNVEIFDTKEEAQKEYDEFTKNPRNYAYEG